MKIKIYDGANTIGGSKIYINEMGYGLFLDFGLNFNTLTQYFKDFIRPRAIRGLHDPLEMGLLPKINIYRGDLVPLDVFTHNFEKITVDAVLITHAHLDHYGMAGYIDFKIPVIASPETAVIMKGMQDSGRTDEGANVVYASARVPSENPYILKSQRASFRNALTPEKKAKYMEDLKKSMLLRKIYITSYPGYEFENFMYLQSDIIRMEFFKSNMILQKSLENISDYFTIKAYPVDHSIYGATAYVIEGDTTLAYTGDIRVHGERKEDTWAFAKSAKHASILIVEGTRLSKKEHPYVEEHDVYENCLTKVEQEKGLVIADFSPRNFERLKMFTSIAKKTDRQLVITEKDAYVLEGLISCGMNLGTENIVIYKKISDRVEWWQKYVRADLSYNFGSDLWPDKFVVPSEISSDPENYILAFSLYDIPNLMDIKPSGGLYIYSSTESLSEEQDFDFLLLHNWLTHYGIKSAGFKINPHTLKPEFEKGYHTSGHVHPADLEGIISTIDPRYIIPVHTENPEWFEEHFEGRVIILENNESIEL